MWFKKGMKGKIKHEAEDSKRMERKREKGESWEQI